MGAYVIARWDERVRCVEFSRQWRPYWSLCAARCRESGEGRVRPRFSLSTVIDSRRCILGVGLEVGGVTASSVDVVCAG